MIPTTYKYIAIIMLCAACYFAGSKSIKPVVETKIEVQTKEVVKTNVVTVTKETVAKDGSRVIETRTEDKSTKDVAIVEKVDLKPFIPTQWHVSTSAEDVLNDRYYELQVQRRLMGSIFVGASINTRHQIGVSVGLEF